MSKSEARPRSWVGVGEDLAAISRGVPSNDLSSEMVCYFLYFTWFLGSNWYPKVPRKAQKRGVLSPEMLS